MTTLKGLLIAGGVTALLATAIAWPVVIAPREVIYGHEILGRHPDAYALIEQFGGGPTADLYAQPLLDLPGRALARLVSPVFAFNVLVLLSFPLTAMATYAFARYLYDSHLGALVAGLAFAFAPIRLAQAAYHADLTQTFWIPLYLLALIATIDRITLARGAGLALAAIGLALSNYYWALFGAVLTPIVLVAFWIIRPDANRNLAPLLWPAAIVSAVALTVGLVLASRDAGPFRVLAHVPMPIDDVSFFRARSWAYLTPSVDHPILGAWALNRFARGGIDLQLVEEQLYLGYALLTLIVSGLAIALWRRDRRWLPLAALFGCALFAFIVSVTPTTGNCEMSLAPGCLGYRLLPLLRFYGRFGIVVSLLAAVLAGAGVMLLRSAGSTGRALTGVLLAVAIFEYWPWPARAHDVLPSSGHRWIANLPDAHKTLDCFPNIPSEQTIPSLMPQPVTLLSPSLPTCSDPTLGATLAARDYTHVIVRDRKTSSRLASPLPEGLTVAKELGDATVYAVSRTLPTIALVGTEGFFGYEHAGDDGWRWMGPTGTWKIRNTSATAQRVELSVDLASMALPRKLTATIDGASAGTFDLPVARTVYRLGPFDLTPGDHVLTFSADGPPARPSDLEDSKDNRALAVAFRNERWTVTN
jgi:hypothetical protein